jgi:hypothetical protein
MVSACVVHLVRRANDLEAVRTFLHSYDSYDAGTAHDLVFILKGYADELDARSVLDAAGDRLTRCVIVDDRGFDVGAYLAAARALEYERLCFVNSFSVIRDEGWLAKLLNALDARRIGIAGASGSYASNLSLLLFWLGAPNRYAGSFGSRVVEHAEAVRIARESGEEIGERSALWQWLGQWLGGIWRLPQIAWCFPRFPACHIRTNAFAIERELLLSFDPGELRVKMDVWRAESGRRSLTRHIERQGLEAVIVGRDGIAYAKQDWWQSATFWQGNQENLLVADNQTELYQGGDFARRRFLSIMAWADRAHPVAG